MAGAKKPAPAAPESPAPDAAARPEVWRACWTLRHDGRVYQAGDVVDLPAEVIERLAAGGVVAQA